MSLMNNVNGVWRKPTAMYANINGVWRDTDQYVNVNGVWRKTYERKIIEESDIKGFRIVYTRITKLKHPDYPDLTINHNLPVKFDLTGEDIGIMNLSWKGVVFQYDRFQYKEEGLLAYRGDIYAELIDEELVNVGLTLPELIPDENRYLGTYPYLDTWNYDRINHLNIEMDGYVLYESNGYQMKGWNSLFNKHQFIDPTEYPDTMDYKKQYRMNSYRILPIESRDEFFDASAYIGIARDMHSADGNMIGSYGVIDHTFNSIRVNGVEKPFVIEIYN